MIAAMPLPAAEPIPVLKVEDRTISGGPDGPPVPVRVYWPQTGGDRLPLVVYFHGGGWVIGGLDSHDPLCRALANEVGAVVISVDYRLAPEHRFPAAAEDAYAATTWAYAHAAELGAAPSRLAVAGDSAGGNLAAVVPLMARDRGGPPLRLQLLVYPVIDCARSTWGPAMAPTRTPRRCVPAT
jgi:acetyl esterase